MKVFKGILTFVLGMIVGILVFVLAIGGTVFALATAVPMSKLLDLIPSAEIVSPDSRLYGQTVWEAVKSVIADVQDYNNLSLKKLYENYGIKVFNGLMGIDFTEKEFYTAPLSEIIADPTIILNSFTLYDIGAIAGLDFSSYGLPILNDNLNVGITTAVDNIMKSFNGEDLSIRAIKDKFGIDLGVGDNAMLAALQDISLSSFGSVIDVLVIDTLLGADTDTFIKTGQNAVYAAVDSYVEVDDPTSRNVTLGAETYIAGGIDSDADGSSDALDRRELRFVQKADGSYVVDNSCYNEDFAAGEKAYYRHMIYEPHDGGPSDNLYIMSYANKVIAVDGDSFQLYQKGFMSIDGLTAGDGQPLKNFVVDGYVDVSSLQTTSGAPADLYHIPDEEISTNSRLTIADGEPVGQTYVRSHAGEAASIMQLISYLSIADLRNSDGLISTLRIGDIIEISDDTASIIKALRNSTLSSIGSDINTLTIDQIIEINDSSSKLMRALATRGCTVPDLATITDSLTIGEIMDIKFDKYSVAADGDFVRKDIYVKYNQYVHTDIDLTAPDHEEPQWAVDGEGKPQRFNLVGDSYVPAENGEYVKTFYYNLYNPDTDGGATRYRLDPDNMGDSIAMQSLARRAVTVADMASIMDELYLPELIRIDNTESTSYLFKSLARHNCKLSGFAGIIDELRLDEVIEIDDDSSTLMKSLKRRGCMISDLGSITDNLTIGEVMALTYDKYVKAANGKYVRIEEDGYTVFDENNPNMQNAQRYALVKGATDSYVEADDGDFVKAFHFELYNPAKHSDSAQRYNKNKVDSSSSGVLQRFANVGLGDFATAFSSLMMSDVMDIESDIYAEATEDELRAYIADESSPLKFYTYDEANSVFKLASRDDITANVGEKTYYKVATVGSSSALLKKLAFVGVDNMAGAMDAVLSDLMLSEIIPINLNAAIELGTSTLSDNDKMYFVDWEKQGRHTISQDGVERKIVYVYDNTGKYFSSDTYYSPATPSPTGTVKFEYTQLTNRDTLRVVQLAAQSNLYYLAKVNVEGVERVQLVNNTSVAAYLFAKGQYESVYYRTKVDDGRSADGETLPLPNHVYEADIYDTSDDLYVEIYGEYVKYDPTNLVHCTASLYKQETGGSYFVPIDDSGYNYVEGAPKISMAYCDDVYVKSETGEYVYIADQYIKYDSSNPDHKDLDRFDLKCGYIATRNEVYLSDSSSEITTNGCVLEIKTVLREQSVAVLRMLAGGTINDMNSVIDSASIGDIMDIAPGSLFDNDAIRNSTLSNLSTNFSNMFTEITIGDIISLTGATQVDKEVKTVLEDVTLSQFFEALKVSTGTGADYGITAGTIYLDMTALFKVATPEEITG